MVDIFKNIEIKQYFLASFICGIYYQVIIQFWQLIAYDSSNIAQKGLYYSIIFSLILIAQSFSGYLIERLSQKQCTFTLIVSSTLVTILFFLHEYLHNNICYNSHVFLKQNCNNYNKSKYPPTFK